MSFFSRRTIAAVAIATVATFPFAGSAAQAESNHAKKASNSHSKQAKKFHAKFVLVGQVKAVGDNSLTVSVKGGNLKKGLRGTDVVVAVTETTKTSAEDTRKTLADVVVGDRVAVKGTRALAEGAVTYTATRIHVKHAETGTQATAPATAAVTS